MPAATQKAPAAPVAADYGLDAPGTVKSMFTRGVMIFLLGFGLWYMNTDTNPKGGLALFVALGAIGLGYILVAAFMVWSSRKGKLSMRDEILDHLQLRGDEKVLDIGCGRGLMLVGAAKRLKTGRVTGVDVWDAQTLSGNTAEAAVANARVEGVFEKVKIENSDARSLPYQPNTFDVVISALTIHNLDADREREKALDQMLRVAKPGGQIVIWDILRTGDYVKHLQAAGAELVHQSGLSFLWCVPGRWLVARKK